MNDDGQKTKGRALRIFVSLMKRVLVSLLAILYLAAGLGFSLREHYCMGEMTSITVEHSAKQSDNHRCDRCGMIKKSAKGCCKDQVKTFKSSPDQSLSKALDFSASKLIADVPSAIPAYTQAVSGVDVIDLPAAPVHGPPLQADLPLYLRIRCLRI